MSRADRRRAPTPTHYTPRGIRRAAAAAAGLNPREWRQLEQLVDSSAWLPARATVPVGARNATAAAVDGVQRLAELGLADGDGANLDDRWRATDAGYELVMATRGRAASRSACSC
ncbi:MAG: hypothetical protein WKF94_16360 [Solirubrobacteraceae bacterium]